MLKEKLSKEKDLSEEGNLPKSREIYFYILMGHIYFWINSFIRNLAGFRTPPLNENQNKNNNSSFKLDVLNGSGGDLTKNSQLMKHIPENPLNDKIITSAQSGVPLITIGDGSKPRVMITAGVHGNELPPQIATLKLINYLINQPIRGTVYIIPFVAPGASAENSKLSEGENLNLVANIPGSPTNMVLNTALRLKITSLADYHGTSTDPAKTSVIYYPHIKSSKIAVHLNKKTHSTLLALRSHPGMLIVLSNTRGIPSVICEVETPDGTASAESIEISFNQMKAFLNYHQII